MIENKRFYRYKTEALYREYGATVTAVLVTYVAVKETPKGYWIKEWGKQHFEWQQKAKWISKTSRRRFAYPTKKEAWNSYRNRVQRRVEHLRRHLAVAAAALEFSEYPERIPGKEAHASYISVHHANEDKYWFRS